MLGRKPRSGSMHGTFETKEVGLNWYEFLCFESPTLQLASKHNFFRTM